MKSQNSVQLAEELQEQHGYVVGSQNQKFSLQLSVMCD